MTDQQPDEAATALGYCGRPTCHEAFATSTGRGRPRLYCSDECRRIADTERKRIHARIAHLEELLRRERHFLASFADEHTAAPGGGQ